MFTPSLGDPIFLELGVTLAALQDIQKAPPGEGPTMLDSLKRKAKVAYHKWALVLHPDRNKGDNEKVKGEKSRKFSDLTAAIKCLEALEYLPSPLPQNIMRTQVVFQVDPRTNVRHIRQTTYSIGQQPSTVPNRRPTSVGPRGIHVVFIRPI